MESSLCWKHVSGCVISRTFPVLFFLLLLPYAFFFFLTLSHAQAPTHTHSCISYAHPQCWYTVFLLCLMKVQSFTCPCSEFITPNLHFLVTSHEFGVVQLHPFLPSLLNLPCSLVSRRCVCWRVHCPKAVQAFLADQWGEGERSRRGNLRVLRVRNSTSWASILPFSQQIPLWGATEPPKALLLWGPSGSEVTLNLWFPLVFCAEYRSILSHVPHHARAAERMCVYEFLTTPEILLRIFSHKARTHMPQAVAIPLHWL